MIIQNESKKIAVTEAQINALKNAYKPQVVQAKETVSVPETNENIINNIVNEPTPEVVNTPSADALITDAPKIETAPVESTNIFEQSIVTDNPSITAKQSEPENVVPVKEEPIAEIKPIDNKPENHDVVKTADINELKELSQKMLDAYYDLQLHVQEVGIKLEEMLEKIQKNEYKQDLAKEEVTQTIALSTPAAPTVEAPKVEQPVVQEQAPQVQSTPVEQQNVFNTSFNPNSEFTGNIFDMPPQTNTESGIKL